jgi:hypothetical protein
LVCAAKAEDRVKTLYNNSTPVGTLSLINTESLKRLGGTNPESPRSQALVWKKLSISEENKDMNDNGERQRVVAVSIRNVSK